jgi:uncharacterized ferritin-like protein (DUF455 family)
MQAEWFAIPSPYDKVKALPAALAEAFALTASLGPAALGRDTRVVGVSELPPKPGLACVEGQARLLHDLGSIELQAMELGLRTLFEFPEAPAEFRKELAEVTLSESRHLALCLEGLEELGYRWGHWDVHLGLWNVVHAEDTLIDRVLIVHRYLEGSGLDAGDSILRRLTGVKSKSVRHAVGVIVEEEIGHVLFGSNWYRTLCSEQKLDADHEFAARIGRIAKLAPRRERIAHNARLKAGFNEFEIRELEKHLVGVMPRPELARAVSGV